MYSYNPDPSSFLLFSLVFFSEESKAHLNNISVNKQIKEARGSKTQRIQEARNQRIKESIGYRIKGPKNQWIHESKNRRIEESESQRTKESMIQKIWRSTK